MFTIGAGSGGVRGSRFATGFGAKVAVAELPFATKASLTTGGVGGTCVLRGCVPKKLLVYGSEFSKEFEDCNGFGWDEFEKPQHNWKKLIAAKNNELERLTGIYKRILANNNVELVEGRGKIVDKNTVEVDGKRFTTKYIMIATGGLPFVPDIPGKDLVITSDDALDLPVMPKKVAVVGAGYIAVEFAGIFKSFGADVSLYFRGDKILRGFDMEVRDFLTEQIQEKGINVVPKTVPVEVIEGEDGRKGVVTSAGGEVEWFDEVMYATGRVPNILDLGLDNAGVETNERGVIQVDDYSQTNVPNIYAVGDVTDRINLTPVALMEGMAVANTLFNGKPTKPDHEYVASAVFSQPPVGSVGYSEEDALEKFGNLKIFTSSFRPLKNTISGSTEKSFMKIIVDSASDRVVGVHMVGEDSAEIMQGIAIAVKMGATKADFDATIGIHPTAAEEFVTMRSATREVSAKVPANA
jgi:glutathione reductase (NADPH)